MNGGNGEMEVCKEVFSEEKILEGQEVEHTTIAS